MGDFLADLRALDSTELSSSSESEVTLPFCFCLRVVAILEPCEDPMDTVSSLPRRRCCLLAWVCWESGAPGEAGDAER